LVHRWWNQGASAPTAAPARCSPACTLPPRRNQHWLCVWRCRTNQNPTRALPACLSGDHQCGWARTHRALLGPPHTARVRLPLALPPRAPPHRDAHACVRHVHCPAGRHAPGRAPHGARGRGGAAVPGGAVRVLLLQGGREHAQPLGAGQPPAGRAVPQGAALPGAGGVPRRPPQVWGATPGCLLIFQRGFVGMPTHACKATGCWQLLADLCFGGGMLISGGGRGDLQPRSRGGSSTSSRPGLTRAPANQPCCYMADVSFVSY
jgi:hypothetical protein